MTRLNELARLPQTSVLLARDSSLYSSIFEENRMCVPLSQISRPVVETLIAVEDRRFFSHGGLDFRGIARALYVNTRALRIIQGGSTITQQLARMAVLRKCDRTLRRKLQEAFVALLIERELTKAEILERYLNAAYFGHNIYGVEFAALNYFGKSAADLDDTEAAYLIGLLKSPTRFCRCCNPSEADRRTRLALRLAGKIGSSRYRRDNTWCIPTANV
jgi:membrane peptidoglycan carboxypeptidase